MGHVKPFILGRDKFYHYRCALCIASEARRIDIATKGLNPEPFTDGVSPSGNFFLVGESVRCLAHKDEE